MKRERIPAPAGSSHHMSKARPMAGKMRERVLKMTSVLQSNQDISNNLWASFLRLTYPETELEPAKF